MGRFAREDVMEVLGLYGVSAARRAADTDGSEEIILVSESVYMQLDVDGLTRALMDVLPHMKVWVAPDGPLGLDNHPYGTPDIIITPIAGNADYLAWVSGETGQAEDP